MVLSLLLHLSWHWIFLVNIPIGIIGILFAARVIPADEPEDRTVSFDYPGAVTLFGAMVFCTFVLEEVAARGVTDPLILTCGALCLLCSGLFVVRELTTPEPFVNIRIFSKWRFTAVLVAYLLVNVIFMGILYLLPFYLTSGDALRSCDKRPVPPDPAGGYRHHQHPVRAVVGPARPPGIHGLRLRDCRSLQRHLCSPVSRIPGLFPCSPALS